MFVYENPLTLRFWNTLKFNSFSHVENMLKHIFMKDKLISLYKQTSKLYTPTIKIYRSLLLVCVCILISLPYLNLNILVTKERS